jgi:hypothetical protein
MIVSLFSALSQAFAVSETDSGILFLNGTGHVTKKGSFALFVQP